ncbi:hypothetical protein AA23498_3008 [Acetobacter nitrogenifigens DSM 23921 = NBRC 105050]|uniref:Uncharacterized protein n=1 Tax=Acetobacter nitrogenifigens DSM 23921 = NBRC 105050 TaxID=1120919 RepID=A0A511XA14_9PROT|nr:hypothetical protein [Acetobacter nitrogenifigens]GBQ97824.1 hypothetical protein AA23498_3008 [Acetobacter nitrogenifigens DSM 23921 = NBRC 105050]GEN59786.1 hypothetical protein ANI02nite_16700 [Acetobacter nitrogenifigens DSM 23921 = NBRC 105050]
MVVDVARLRTLIVGAAAAPPSWVADAVTLWRDDVINVWEEASRSDAGTCLDTLPIDDDAGFDLILCAAPLDAPNGAQRLLERLSGLLSVNGVILAAARVGELVNGDAVMRRLFEKMSAAPKEDAATCFARLREPPSRAAAIIATPPVMPDDGGPRYTISELSTLVEAAGLTIDDPYPRACYDIALLLESQPRLWDCAANLSASERRAAAFALCVPEVPPGETLLHVVSLRPAAAPARSYEASAIPVLLGCTGIALSMSMTDDHFLPVQIGAVSAMLPLPPQARGVAPLIDGRRGVADLARMLATRGVDQAQFDAVWGQMAATLQALGALGFRPSAASGDVTQAS